MNWKFKEEKIYFIYYTDRDGNIIYTTDGTKDINLARQRRDETKLLHSAYNVVLVEQTITRKVIE